MRKSRCREHQIVSTLKQGVAVKYLRGAGYQPGDVLP